jgi:enamine deaminase RidA (YjgF/YER057c/UK114 family)
VPRGPLGFFEYFEELRFGFELEAPTTAIVVPTLEHNWLVEIELIAAA